MAHIGTKGYYVQQLINLGIKKHPVTQVNIKKYNTAELRRLFHLATVQTSE